MFDFKFGQRVIYKKNGVVILGKIYSIKKNVAYPIFVDLDNGNSKLFTIDGKISPIGDVSLFPFRGTPESRRIVAMLANEWRKHKKELATVDPCRDDLGGIQSAASLEHHFKKTYLKAKQLLNEEGEA